LAALDLDPGPAARSAPAIDLAALEATRVLTIPGAARVVIVDGTVRPELSDWTAATAGAELFVMAADEPLPAWAAERFGAILQLERMPLAAANAAAWQHGLAIRKTGTAGPPLHLVFVTAAAPVMANPRVLIVVEPGAVLDVIESHVGEGPRDDMVRAPSLANGVTEADVGRGGRLSQRALVDADADCHHIWATAVRLAADAAFEGFVMTLGGAIVRNETRLCLAGENAQARVNGAYAVAGASHVDNTTFMDHALPHARSTQVFKGVVGGSARAVYQGKVLVRPDAQKTDAQQLHKAMLLTPTAEVDAKPELEIYADDVKCGHGAAIGRLDEDTLFYLLARGIKPARARELLIAAFLGEALDGIADEAVREAFDARLQHRLKAVQESAR
ncbi:MAG: Fe-S cluster assembly protein SufD, partial [Proteobacteria bacterium]|nr:Fe-S cluster assembly protein SufD [Pseudomonadota bacterium]